MGTPATTDIEPTLGAVAPPIMLDDDGTARIGLTRVTMDTFVDAFNAGYGAEELVLKFPSINLPDAYAVIAYYLSHKDTVDGYIAHRAENAVANLTRVRAEFEMSALRTKLLSLRRSE
jgi:uncharacterized protein (DUF433 family)